MSNNGGEYNMISFNKPPYVGKEKDYIAEAIAANNLRGWAVYKEMPPTAGRDDR